MTRGAWGRSKRGGLPFSDAWIPTRSLNQSTSTNTLYTQRAPLCRMQVSSAHMGGYRGRRTLPSFHSMWTGCGGVLGCFRLLMVPGHSANPRRRGECGGARRVPVVTTRQPCQPGVRWSHEEIWHVGTLALWHFHSAAARSWVFRKIRGLRWEVAKLLFWRGGLLHCLG
ncbi:hypothetical protein LX36DRAFT_165771 [Colletotrichum falcatum]|nr:hypothetical protein LX36DRAFT_165771 [Colletotrichum falcatum]